MPTEIILSRSGEEIWIAVKENGRVVELQVHREEHRSLVGNVYKGRVTRVMRGMQSAFVDIGMDRDGFLYAGDLPGAGPRFEPGGGALAGDVEDEADENASGDPADSRWSRIDIRDLVRSGDDLLVQVSKDAIGTKGPRVTGIVTLAGRSLVLLPRVDHLGISRRITDLGERERLRAVVGPLRPPGCGLIVRTAGEGCGDDALRDEAAALGAQWDTLRERAAEARAPSLVRRELPLPLMVLRDHAGPDLLRVAVDDADLHDECLEYLRTVLPDAVELTRRHEETDDLLDREGVTPAIGEALRSKVWMRSGGYLVINQTEALVAIDVNTGRYLGRKNLEDTALRINLEAAVEVARQLRLRDLGGIIVVDFIDMEREDSRQRLVEAIEAALRRDRARTRLLGMSEFGLVELTRKRSRRSLERALCRPCAYCSGRGRVKGAVSVAGEIVRELRRQGLLHRGGRVRLRVHPDVAAVLRAPGARWLEGPPGAPPLEVELEVDTSLHAEAFELSRP